MKNYSFVSSKPVARFYYQGIHSHPVRRTVLIIKQSARLITGYELREGSEVRKFKDAPIKSYCRKKIAKIRQIDRRRILRKAALTNEGTLQRTTLVRTELKDLIKSGA